MKKIFTVLISVLMVFSLFTAISAEDEDYNQVNNEPTIDTVVDYQDDASDNQLAEDKEDTVEVQDFDIKEEIGEVSNDDSNVDITVNESNDIDGDSFIEDNEKNLEVKTIDADELLTVNNVVFLDKDTFRNTLKSVAANMAEDSSINLYLGNSNDYDISGKTLVNQFGDNNYYSIYSDKVDSQDNHDVYDIYVIASGDGKVYFPEDSSRLFLGQSDTVYGPTDAIPGRYFISINFKNIDTSYVTNMSQMFRENYKLSSLDVSMFDTSNVTDMSWMFSTYGKNKSIFYYSSFESNLKTIAGLEKFDTSNVTNMSYMFYRDSSLRGANLKSFYTSNVTDMSYMFYNCVYLKELNLDNFDTSKVKNMSSMFEDCYGLFKIYVGDKFTTSNVNSSEKIFDKCKQLVGALGTSYQGTHIDDISYAHVDCGESNPGYFTKVNSKHIYDGINFVDNLEFCKVIRNLIEESNRAYRLYIGNKNDFDLSGKELAYEFEDNHYSLYVEKSYNYYGYSSDYYGYDFYLISNDGDKVYLPVDSSRMFVGATNEFGRNEWLKEIIFKSVDTSYVVNMQEMFDGCTYLRELDLSNFNTSNVNNMKSMFSGCSELYTLIVKNFNTSKVENMSRMFYNCSKLPYLYVGNFNTSNVTDMSNMFLLCRGLIQLDVSNFDTSKVTNIENMFGMNDHLSSLNLGQFKTYNVTNMSSMFNECNELETLDLSSFYTGNVTNMSDMFNACYKLKTIYVSDKFTNANVNNSTRMFKNCTSLIGGSGTKYDGSYIDVSFAHIDGGDSNPGYFTYMEDKNGVFSDVYTYTDHYDDISWLASTGISKGWSMPNGSIEFRPYDDVTRADMAAFIRRLAVTFKKDDASVWSASEELWNTFVDVDKDGDYHQEDILWLADKEISKGWSDGTFRPLENVARADMAAFIRRLASYYDIGDAKTYSPTDEDLGKFSDVDENVDHYEDILWLAHTGISTGFMDGTFRPLDSVKRCDMAAFLHRLANLNNN